MTRFVGQPATVIAAAVRSGETTAAAVVRDHLARVAALDPALRAFAVLRAEQAVAEAEAVDARADRAALPLAGVPVAIKDNIAVAGLPRRMGSRAVPDRPMDRDDELVRRIREAGAVVLGTTRMPELAIWPFTEFDGDEPVRNPWNPDYSCGGSSGGAAVAVASGMSPLAVGSDGGGSLRIPAACCGVVGVKPGPGVVPVAGRDPVHWHGLTEYGPIAATAVDAALLLSVLSGQPAFRDPAVPEGPLRVAISVRPVLRGVRMHPEAAQATRRAAELLGSAGHHVAAADPPYPATLGPRFSLRWLSGIAQDAAGLDRAGLAGRTRRMAAAGQVVSRLGLATGVPDRRLAGLIGRWFDGRDVLLTPTLTFPALPVDRWQGAGWARTMLGSGGWVMTTPWNLVGYPAASVPIGMSSSGVPLGVQVVVPPGAEARLLAVLAQLEQLAPLPRWQPPG